MDMLMMKPQVAQGVFPPIGSAAGETYVPSSDCLETLREMIKKMSEEDKTSRTLRRAIGFSQLVKKDLIPLLINTKDNRRITDTAIKVLADLTTPVECLLPIEVISKSEIGRNTIIELNWLLISCKETFLDSRATKKIVDHIRDILYKDNLDEKDCETLNDCIILLRNILHIPDSMMNVAEGFSEHNQILWNLFAHNFDKVLIEMITGPLRKEWRIAMAQLVVLIYKDQRVVTLQKLLILWMESADLSESSEDNESNTSPPEEESFSSGVTNSDSSDNSGSDRKMEIKPPGKRKQSFKQPYIKKQEEKQESWSLRSSSDGDQKMEVSSTKMSDCGYGTQAENQESVSSSSYDDIFLNRSMKPVHHKPPNMIQKRRHSNGKVHLTSQEKDELRRKKLTRRFQSNMVNMKALLHHTPTEEDISQLLKEFTVDFLLIAYDTLVSEVRLQLVKDSTLDRTHFSWLIAYFLKFVVQLELDFKHIRGILSLDVLTFLAQEGTNLCEEYEILSSQPECDMSSNIRKVHLVTTAVKELLLTINSYKKMKHLSDSEKDYLTNLQKEIGGVDDIRSLFVALLKQFNIQVHNKQYLRDLVVTNHILLTLIESSSDNSLLQSHMNKFVSVEMMRLYGYLLESYKVNGHFVNDCVFTMMHHVAGDLDHVSTLFQPTILKTFSIMWENDFEILDDWSDLIEYVIHKFISTPHTIPSVVDS